MGDFIIIKDPNGYPMDQMYFGTISGSQISAPKQGQSIVNYAFHCWTSSQTIEYHKVKDNHPTIGFNAFTPYNISASSTTGTFTGFVYDKAYNPVPGIHIGNRFYNATSSTCGMFFVSALSGADGSFTIPERSGKYLVQLFYDPLRILSDSILNIEPDSVNYFEFTIDTLLTSMNPRDIKKGINLSCFPNPSTGETTISFDASGRHYSKALIKIHNSNGEMVRILPVNVDNAQNKYSIKWNGSCSDNSTASGIYFCNLELDGRKVASTKIIIEK